MPERFGPQERTAAIEQSFAGLDERLAELGVPRRQLAAGFHGLAARRPGPGASGPFTRARDAVAGRS